MRNFFLKLIFVSIIITMFLVGSPLLVKQANAAITIDNKSGSVIFMDEDVTGYNSVYLVFQITSDSNVADAWVELVTGAGNIQNVGTGVHQMKFKPGAGTADPVLEAGLVIGEPKGVFFMVDVTAGVTGTSQNLTVNVYDGDPGGGGSPITITGPNTFEFTEVYDTIKANANKVTTVVTIPDNPEVGELGTITVTGCTGTVKETSTHGWVLYFSPVSTATNWPVDTFEFIDSVIEIPGYANTPYKNMAKIPTGDVVKENHCYTETFTFVINGPGSGSTTPANYIASGQQIKHTVNDSGSFNVTIVEECPEITVTSAPATLPEGNAGFAYGTVQFSASGGVGPYAFTISALPTGMTFTPAGALSGTPAEGGTFNFTVTATDQAGEPADCTGQTTRALTINCPTLTVSPTSLTSGLVNVAYGPVQFSASGGTGSYMYEVTSGDLPAGMTFSSGELGGTPTEVGTFIFTIGAVDNNTTCPVLNPVELTLSIRTPSTGIPTLSEWGMIIFSLMLAGSAIWMMRRRRNEI